MHQILGDIQGCCREHGDRVKISPVQEITVSGNTKIHRVLKNIAPGEKVSAEIIKPLEGNKAVLRVAGMNIIAQFLKDIPRGKHVELVLTSRRKSTLVFSLVSDKKDISAGENYRRFIIMDDGNARESLYRIRTLLAEGHSLYDINRLLAGITGQTSGGAFAGFLNALLKKGISRKDAVKIAALLLNLKKGSERVFSSIIAAMAAKYDATLENEFEVIDGSFERETAGYPGDVLESLVWDDELREHFSRLLSWLLNGSSKDAMEREIPVYDDEKFNTARMITKGSSIACAFDLSELGHLEVFARVFGEIISLSIVCESDKSVEILRHDLYNLQKKLHSLIKNGAMVAVFRDDDARSFLYGEIDAVLTESRVDIHA